MKLPPERLAEIQAWHEKATPGPENVSACCRSMCEVIPALLEDIRERERTDKTPLETVPAPDTETQLSKALAQIERWKADRDDDKRIISGYKERLDAVRAKIASMRPAENDPHTVGLDAALLEVLAICGPPPADDLRAAIDAARDTTVNP
jgi:hypothetical protein